MKQTDISSKMLELIKHNKKLKAENYRLENQLELHQNVLSDSQKHHLNKLQKQEYAIAHFKTSLRELGFVYKEYKTQTSKKLNVLYWIIGTSVMLNVVLAFNAVLQLT